MKTFTDGLHTIDIAGSFGPDRAPPAPGRGCTPGVGPGPNLWRRATRACPGELIAARGHVLKYHNSTLMSRCTTLRP